MARKQSDPPPVEPREFRSPEEIDLAITKLRRRIQELEQLDIAKAYLQSTGSDTVAVSNVIEAIREVFGPNSPEFNEHRYITLWHNVSMMADESGTIDTLNDGRRRMVGILNGLIARLEEKKLDLTTGLAPAPSTYFDRLSLHPRIRDVARDLFLDGHPWDAVLAAAKTLVNYVKDRSNRHDLDGTPLMRAVFSKNDPILAFNDLASQHDFDEQEGIMHLFEGAVLAIRNPAAHTFPEGSEQRAIEYISFLSLLAYRVQEAQLRKKTS